MSRVPRLVRMLEVLLGAIDIRTLKELEKNARTERKGEQLAERKRERRQRE